MGVRGRYRVGVWEHLGDSPPPWPGGPMAGGEGGDLAPPESWESYCSLWRLEHSQNRVGRLPACLLWSEPAASPGRGASLGRLALTLCCQRRCHPRTAPTVVQACAGSGGRGGAKLPPPHAPSHTKSQQVKAREPKASGGSPGGPAGQEGKQGSEGIVAPGQGPTWGSGAPWS